MTPEETVTFGTQGSGGFDEVPGAQVGPYKLISPLGEGGFGSVWLAERRHPFVQRVALKLVKAGMDSKAVVARSAAAPPILSSATSALRCALRRVNRR